MVHSGERRVYRWQHLSRVPDLPDRPTWGLRSPAEVPNTAWAVREGLLSEVTSENSSEKAEKSIPGRKRRVSFVWLDHRLHRPRREPGADAGTGFWRSAVTVN